jgi:hypothetical protein
MFSRKDVMDWLTTEQLEFELWRRSRPDKPCPRPDLEDKIVAREFQLQNSAIKTFFGCATWDPKAGSFLIRYQDGDTAHATVDDVDEYRLNISKCHALIKKSGGRCHTFCHLIKILAGHSSLDGNIRTSRGTLTFRRLWKILPGLSPLDDDETHVGPHMWPRLGTYENEKIENAKKIIEIVFCN